MSEHIKMRARGGEEICSYVDRCIATAAASGCVVDAEHNAIQFPVFPTHGAQAYYTCLRALRREDE